MRDFLKIFQELIRFLIKRPIVGALLFLPLILSVTALVVWDYFCVDPEFVIWALVVSVPLSGTLIRVLDHDAASFLVGDRWSLPIFMMFSLAVNAMIAGVIIVPYWFFRILINPVCQ